MAFSALDPTLGLIGTANLYECNDLYDAVPFWYQLTGVTGVIRGLHCDQHDSNILYVVKSNKTIVRVDDLQNGTPIYNLYNVPAFTSVTGSITTVGSDSSVVYLAGNSKVYRSADKGATWVNVTANLPNVNIIKIVDDPASTDESVYVCSAAGVWYKNNTMTNWINFSNGLPVIATINEFMCYFDGTSNSRLKVAYYGRGVWESPTYSTLMGTSTLKDPSVLHLSLSPNPAADLVLVTCSAPTLSTVTLRIVSITGQQLLTKEVHFSNGNLREQLNLGGISAGVYVVELQTAGKVIVQERLVIQP
jgi:hypothetical protein